MLEKPRPSGTKRFFWDCFTGIEITWCCEVNEWSALCSYSGQRNLNIFDRMPGIDQGAVGFVSAMSSDFDWNFFSSRQLSGRCWGLPDAAIPGPGKTRLGGYDTKSQVPEPLVRVPHAVHLLHPQGRPQPEEAQQRLRQQSINQSINHILIQVNQSKIAKKWRTFKKLPC